MDFKTVFLKSLIWSKVSPQECPEMFMGQILSWEEKEEFPDFRLLSCGKNHAGYPWSFEIRSLDCFLLLYTESGCGKLLLNNQVYVLDEGAFLCLDCRQGFRMDIAVEPWVYKVFFVAGEPSVWYRKFFTGLPFSLFHISVYSDLSMSMERILSQYPASRLPQKLMVADFLHHLISGCACFRLASADENTKKIPSYIEEMHTLFEQEFQKAYTLDELEKRFGISKYRLCREFGLAYGIPPFQYLNRRRVKAAKHLLLTTDYHIHVIGSMVGIDNTNHFIALFKRYTNVTPLEYKQRMTL